MAKAYAELIDFIAAGTTPISLMAFQASAETRARVNDLIQKEKDAGLSPEEKTELDDYLTLEHIIRMAKARAASILSR